ncbi:MAG: class I SAM-dependent methyltransferase [Desulfobulbaceae bacterium]|nr:class I SAM-dependent methyltransferase [Desulfobulbaceae bacterium]
MFVSDLFKEKAENYDSEEWAQELSSVVGAMITAKIPFHDQMHVMDFGAGTGLLSATVAPMVKKITAVDISEAMLEKLTAKAELKNKVYGLCQDIMVNPIDEKFDLIMSAFAMHHVENTNKLIQSFATHLQRGALIALVDVDTEDGSFHSDDNLGVFHWGFDRDDLKTILEMYSFENIDFKTAHHFDWQGRKYSAFLVTASKV